MHSAFFKVPFLLVQAYCARIVVKAPNPPPATEERNRYIKDNNVPDASPFSDSTNAKYCRYPIYAIAFAEMLALLLSTLSPLPFIPQIFRPSSSLNNQEIRLSNIYLLGVLLMCTGASIRAACYRHLGRLFTFELSVKKNHRLVTDGPYAIVRHPGYIGSCLFFLGACCSQLGSGSWLAASGLWSTAAGRVFAFCYLLGSGYTCWFLLSRVPKEDLVLRREFGQQWESWAKQTPYKLIPYVY